MNAAALGQLDLQEAKALPAFVLAAGKTSPLVDPAFVIENCPAAPSAVLVNSTRRAVGPSFRWGHEKTDKRTDLVLWLAGRFSEPVSIAPIPARQTGRLRTIESGANGKAR